MNFRKTIVIGDIHGCYNTLVALLKNDDLNIDFQQDRVIFLGDYIDRGNFPLKTVLAVKSLQEKHPENVICLKGNHEDMCCKFYFSNNRMWSWNGYENSYSQIENYENKDELLQWMDNLPLRYETDNYCFCHSGNWSTDLMPGYDVSYCLWDRDWLKFKMSNNCDKNKPVIFGHTPVEKVTYIGDNIDIDTGACYVDYENYGHLTALIINNDDTKDFVSIATEIADY